MAADGCELASKGHASTVPCGRSPPFSFVN